MRCKFIDQDGKVCARETQYKWALCESHYNRVSDFQRKVVHLISRPGVEVSYTTLYSKETKILLEVTLGIIQLTILLECYEGESHLPPEKVYSFFGLIKSRSEIHRGICVSSSPFTPEAKALQTNLPGLDLYAIDDLMSSLINFDSYLQGLSAQLEQEVTSGIFQSPTGKFPDGRLVKNIEEYIDAWLADKTRNIITFLGDEGSGKTTLVNRIAFNLTSKALSKVKTRIPLVIPLHTLIKVEDFEYFLLNLLSDLYNLRIETYGVLEKVIENGQLVFLLDGLGEALEEVSVQDLNRSLDHLLKLKHRNNKILITGNTSYFKVDGVSTALFRKLEEAGSEMVEIQSLNKVGINRYLEGVFGDGIPPAIQNAIFGAGELRELAKDVFWLHVTTHIHSRERAKLSETVTSAELIQLYANVWLNTDVPGMAPPEERNFLADEIAYEMTRRGTLHIAPIHYPDSVKDRFKDKMERDGSFKYFDDLLTKCKYLGKDLKGRLCFSHKIFLDFFTARKIAQEIGNGNYRPLEEISLNPRAAGLLSKLVDPSALKEKFLQSGGWMKRNIMTILYSRGEAFDGMDLTGANLEGGNFQKASFKKALLKGAILRGANLSGANFSMANLEGANLEGANLSGVVLSGAKLEGANFEKVELGSTDLQGVNFWKVHLGAPEQELKAQYVKLGAIFTPTTQRQE